ncbi:hypothetical protein [Aestuariivita boseongensis]|uniref:hypothetical protein n=1 Tax=Aestuariivita boseongensis TaxID=1470562 RepID=UPI0006821DC0|nr:hypothetical protein [Aestuariivita boseongensis]
MRTLIIAALACSVIAGCNRKDERILFDGQAFRAKATHVEKSDRRDFVASVSPVSASLEGAREAGRYEGTKYCINEYGTSQITWTASPDAEPQAWTLDRDTVTFAGRCEP